MPQGHIPLGLNHCRGRVAPHTVGAAAKALIPQDGSQQFGGALCFGKLYKKEDITLRYLGHFPVGVFPMNRKFSVFYISILPCLLEPFPFFACDE